MRLLPAITFLLLSLFFVPRVIAADAKPESIGTVDKSDAAWGKDIIINGRQNANGTLSLPGATNIGPETGQLKFPNLEEIDSALTETIPFLLPENLRQQFEASPPQKTALEGKIYHPVCKAKTQDGKEIKVSGTPSTGATTVTTPDWWTHLLGITKLVNSAGAPEADSGAAFGPVTQPTFDNSPNEAGNCDEAQKELLEGPSIPAAVSGFTNIDFFKLVTEFIGGIFNPGEEVQVVIRPKKLLPGEADFANQTSDKLGFLRSFCPQGLCTPIDKINEGEKTRYTVGGEQVLDFKGVAGTRTGFDTLEDSLYPAGAPRVPRPLPSGPQVPNTPGTGIFKLTGTPQSPRLENLIRDAANSFGVPPAVLAGVAWIEGVQMWSYSDDQIAAYSAPGAQDPKNCQPNGCGARGPMQFLNDGIALDCQALTGQKMPDVWNFYSSAVNEATGQSRQTNVCNTMDAIYAAAKKLKENSGSTSTNWSDEEVNRAGSGYYGSCGTTFDRLGNRTYCGFLLDNYK